MKVLPIREITIETGGILSLRPPDLSDFFKEAEEEIRRYDIDADDDDLNGDIDKMWEESLSEEEWEAYRNIFVNDGKPTDYDNEEEFIEKHGVHVCAFRCYKWGLDGRCDIDGLFHKPLCKACHAYAVRYVETEEEKQYRMRQAARERKNPLYAAQLRMSRHYAYAVDYSKKFEEFYQKGELVQIARLMESSGMFGDIYMKRFNQFPGVFNDTAFGSFDKFKEVVKDAIRLYGKPNDTIKGESDNG